MAQFSKQLITSYRPSKYVNLNHLHNYATVSSSSESRNHRHQWPTTPHPSPYEILSINSSDTYSKENFLTLVKLYHPDRICSQPTISHLTPEQCLERYKLVVAAHSILADPEKRKSYDRFGIGWSNTGNGQYVQKRASAQDSSYAFSSAAYERHGPDGVHQNATWEDWERWRWEQWQKEKNHDEPEPNYVPNRSFAALVFGTTLIGFVLQNGLVWGISDTRRYAINERSSKAEAFMKAKKDETRQMNKSGRIVEFMKQREPGSMDDPRITDMVLRPDTCASLGVPSMDRELRKKLR